MGVKVRPASIGAGRSPISVQVSADPAAGAQPTLEVPAGERWLVHACVVRLVTSAVAANRRVNLDLIQSGFVVFSMQAGAVQTASLTVDYYFENMGVNLTAITDNLLFVNSPFPIPVVAGDDLSILTVALDPGDNFGTLKAYVERI